MKIFFFSHKEIELATELGSVAQFYWSKLPDLTNWFDQAEIAKKRYELATLIQVGSHAFQTIP